MTISEEHQALLKRYEPKESGVITADPQVVEVRFSPSGALLAAAGYDARVRVWTLDNGVASESNSITGHNGWVHSVAFHPTESTIYSADSWGQLRATRWIDEVPASQWVQTHAHDGWIRQIALNSDARLLASCAADKRVCLWNSETGELIGELLGHDEDVQSVQFGPRSRVSPRLARVSERLGYVEPDVQLVATGDAKGKVRLWDVGSRKLVRVLDAAELWLLHRLQDVGGVRVIRFNPSGTLVACGGVKPANGGTVQGEPTLLIFDVATGERKFTIKFGEQKDCQLHDLHWTSDDVLMGVTCGTPGTGKLVFHRLGDERAFYETTKFPNCQSLSYHSASNTLAVLTTNRNSNGNGRRLNKDGQYEGNTSPIHLFKLGQSQL